MFEFCWGFFLFFILEVQKSHFLIKFSLNISLKSFSSDGTKVIRLKKKTKTSSNNKKMAPRLGPGLGQG
jgi:hypothetical protein